MAYIGKSPSQAVRNRYYYTQSGNGATSLSGSDDASNTLTFADGNYVDVLLNGVTLVAGIDYNTSTANTIAGLSALSSGDVVQVIVYDTFSVFSGNVNGDFTVGGDIVVSGTVDSRDVNADGTKLDGIEASADVTDATNVAAAGALMTSGGTLSGNLDLGDNVRARFGAGSDLQITHTGGHSQIVDSGTGGLFIGGSSQIGLMNPALNEYMVNAVENGAVTLYHDNSAKIATTSSGVSVTGATTVTKGSAGTLATFTDGVNSNFVIETASLITTVGNTGGSTALAFKSANTERMRITSGGITTVGGTSGAARLNAVAQNWPENALGIYSANISGQTNFAGIAFFNQDTDSAVANVADIYTNPTGTLSLTSASNPAIQLKYGSGGISGGTPALTVDNGGRIGISTTNPLSSLHVAGALDTSPAASGVHLGNSGDYAGMEMRGSIGAFIDFGPNDDAVDYRGRIMYTHSDNRMSFFTNGAGAAEVQMRDNGNLRLRGNDQRIEMLTNDNDYTLGSSGGAAIRFRNQGSGEEIGFETHHAGVQHTEVMNISTRGFVTMPNQPVFSAYRNGTNVPDSTVIVWTNTTANVGSHYNTANGRFTAPVTGNYFFSVFAMSPSTTGGFGIRLRLNGTPSGTTWAYVNSSTIYQYKTVTMSFVIGLNATDYIEIMTQGGTMHSAANYHNNFCGYLVG